MLSQRAAGSSRSRLPFHATAFSRWLIFIGLLAAACSDAAGGAEHPLETSQALAPTLNWPADQLLPSFPTPAPTQDLIQLHEQEQHWEAEGPSLSHKTGRLETDGWLCQTGIDTPNDHMIYGPYDTTVPAGANTALFRLKIDNSTADDVLVVTLEAYDSTSGKSLATMNVTRKQFTVAGDYTTFSLPFSLDADNHALELRVFWTGAAYTKADWVGVSRSQADDELVLFASLKGLVNAKQPRIFSYEGDAFAEGPHAWLDSLGLKYNEIANNWDLIAKYQSEVEGIIVYDNSVPDTVNLATTLASSKHALVVAPSMVAKLTAAPYNFPIVADFRGKFANKLAVYQALYDQYWPTLPHRLALGLNPGAVRAAVREYAAAVGAASMWLDPEQANEQALLDKFLSSMGAGAVWMGWWPSEGSGVSEASKYGIATVASDFASNLTLHSGMPRTIHVQKIPAKPKLENKLYVAFILSDGDNLQYVEHLERKLWANGDRGKVPMGWTLSPAMVDAMPGALNYLWSTATDNDCLLSGPSGYGYTYPNLWTVPAQLDAFVTKTESYEEQAGFRVITVWNTITGGINQNVGDSYAKHGTSLLGLTAQNTGGGLTIYQKALPGMALSCNYCTGEPAMHDFINSSSQGWDGKEPRFLIIQAQPWQDVKPTNFMNVANSLGSDYVVVRPDHIFELIREANGLPVNPLNQYTITVTASAHGSVSPTGTVTVTQNDSQAFTLTPDAGYVAHISVDGANVGTDSSYTFTNVTKNHALQITFAPPSAMMPDAAMPDANAPDAQPPVGGSGAGGSSGALGSGGAGHIAGNGAAGAGSPPNSPSNNNGCGCGIAGRASLLPGFSALFAALLLARARRRVRSLS